MTEQGGGSWLKPLGSHYLLCAQLLILKNRDDYMAVVRAERLTHVKNTNYCAGIQCGTEN